MKKAWNKGMRTGKERPCIVCNKVFYTPPSQNHLKYCSQKCYHSIKENHAKNKGMTWKLSKETRKKQSESQIGEKNHQWKGGITEDRKTVYHKRLRRRILKRDNFECCVCKKKGTMDYRNKPQIGLVVHHLNSYDKHKKLRFEDDNCILLCEECHYKFHQNYGFGNNTIKQFIEWIQNEERENNKIRERISMSISSLQSYS